MHSIDISKFLAYLDQHAAVKIFRSRRTSTPFITAEIKEPMEQKDKQLKITRKIGNERDWEELRIQQRSLKAKIKMVESECIRNQIEENKQNSASLKKTNHHCFNPCGTSHLPYSSNSMEIVDELNTYFNSVGGNASDKAQELVRNFNLPVLNTAQDNSSDDATRNNTASEFFLQPVSTAEVQNIITSIPSNKSPGHDKVSMKVTKDCLSHRYTTDCNKHHQCVPAYWRVPKILENSRNSPTPKMRPQDTNSRPISLLPALSKVIEKIAHNKLLSYLNYHNKLSDHQSGNRKNHSTKALGIFFTNELFKAFDYKEVTVVL